MPEGAWERGESDGVGLVVGELTIGEVPAGQRHQYHDLWERVREGDSDKRILSFSVFQKELKWAKTWLTHN